MTTPLKERIGGCLQPEVVHQVFQEMQDAPVKAASQMLAHRLNPVLEVLDDEQKRSVVWSCVEAWFEVPDNVTRITQHLDRRTPDDMKSWKELVVGFAVCRVHPLGRPVWVPRGLRGADEAAVVLLPLQDWSADNGMFCTASMVPGQDICLGGTEEVTFPGTGGCLILLIILKLPRRRDPES